MTKATKKLTLRIAKAIAVIIISLLFGRIERGHFAPGGEVMIAAGAGVYIANELRKFAKAYKKLVNKYKYEKAQSEQKDRFIDTMRETIFVMHNEKIEDENHIKALEGRMAVIDEWMAKEESKNTHTYGTGAMII